MLLCASSALVSIWFDALIPQRLIPTFFIVGFASFLIWAPLVAYRFLRNFEKKKIGTLLGLAKIAE